MKTLLLNSLSFTLLKKDMFDISFFNLQIAFQMKYL